MRRAIGILLLLAACGDGGGEGDGGVAGSGGGASPFDEAVLAAYELSLPAAEWEAMVAAPWDETWRRATLVWQGETWTDVAVRPTGNRSRFAGNPKPSLRLDFDEFVPGREFHGYETLKLDGMPFDPALMRERLAYPIYAAAGVSAPRMAHAKVFVNGRYKGVYAAEERVNKEFVTKRYGSVFHQVYNWTREANDILWNGSDPGYYVGHMFRPVVESLPPGGEEVMNLVDALNHQPPAEVEAVFDLGVFLAFMAVEVLIGEGDGYNGGLYPPGADIRSGNFHLYRVPGARFVFIAHDRDQSYWRQDPGILTGFSNRLLTRRLILEHPPGAARYRELLRSLVDGPHATAALHARIDAVAAQIRDAVQSDPHKGVTNEEWEWQVQGIKDYIRERNDAVRAQLSVP